MNLDTSKLRQYLVAFMKDLGVMFLVFFTSIISALLVLRGIMWYLDVAVLTPQTVVAVGFFVITPVAAIMLLKLNVSRFVILVTDDFLRWING